MKNLFSVFAVALLVFANIGYADTVTSSGNVTVTQQPDNKHAGNANTTTTEKTTTVKVETIKQGNQETKTVTVNTGETDESGSVYDSVRTGWNKFIDLLVGPKK